MQEWGEYCDGKFPDKPEKPNNIPVDPRTVYSKTGWIGYKDWCFYKPMPFEEARKFVWSLNLESVKEWRDYCEGKSPDKPVKPANIPNDPEKVYREDGWIGYKDWCFGGWVSFEEARKFAQSLNLKNMKEWNDYCAGKFPRKPKKPANIPNDPAKVYREDGWVGARNWLRKIDEPFVY